MAFVPDQPSGCIDQARQAVRVNVVAAGSVSGAVAISDDGGAPSGYELRTVFQAMLFELRAIRIGMQYLVSSREDSRGGLNLVEAAQEYDEEIAN